MACLPYPNPGPLFSINSYLLLLLSSALFLWGLKINIPLACFSHPLNVETQITINIGLLINTVFYVQSLTLVLT